MRAVQSAVIAAILVLVVACSGSRRISHNGIGAYEASLAAVTDGFAVAWYDSRDGNPEIYARLIDARGRPRGPERRLTDTPESSYEADIRAAHNNLAVAWYEKSADGTVAAKLGLWSREGRARWATTISSAERGGRNPLVRVNGGELFCAWLEDTGGEGAEIWAGWWDLQGHPVVPVRRLAPAGRTTWNLNAALDAAGRASVVFDARAGTRTEELFLVRVDKTTNDLVRLTSDDGFSSKYPDLIFGGDRVAMTWFDMRNGNEEVYLFVSELDALGEGLETRARRITNTSGESIWAYVGWNGQRFGLVWNDDTDGQSEIYFQSFNPSGTPLALPQRLTHNQTSSSIAAIQPLNGGFALAWTEHTPTQSGRHQSSTRSDIVFSTVR